MKRVLSFILALTMTLTLCACGSGSGKLSPYLMDFQFGAGEEATEKTILDLEKNDTFTVNGIEFSSVVRLWQIHLWSRSFQAAL